jgi:hypothetical protein
MDGTVTPQKDPAMDWDIMVSAKAGTGESISGVEVRVNGFTKFSETFNPTTNQWQRTLLQQGTYPGDNNAELIVTNAKGEKTSYCNEWS